jgi:Ca-activated chloride channel family protein
MVKHTAWLCCLLTTIAAAQNGPLFRSNVDIVVVPLTVVDASGTPVADLTRDEFQIFDNEIRRPIQSFSIDNDLPLTLGVMIDASESQKEQVSEHRRTATDLLQRILRPGDSIFVISVDENVTLLLDVTTVSAGLPLTFAMSAIQPFGEPCPRQRIGIRGVRAISACGSSPLWNAIYDAALFKLRPLTGTKALLLLTDGFDSGSTHTWRQAADALSQANATIYAIQYRSGFGGNFAPDFYRLVTDAGGTWFHAREGQDGAIAARIETDLRHRYVLGFRPERLSGKIRHDIRVEVDRPNLTVRARKTYFDAPH